MKLGSMISYGEASSVIVLAVGNFSESVNNEYLGET